MAKINLLTIHWGNSYGGVMQTYATIKILQKLGHSVSLINLFHPSRKNVLFGKHDTRIYWLIEEIQFAMFRMLHFGHKTRKMYSITNGLIPKCDVTIVGSDQVWNSEITGPLQLSYFLEFVKQGDMMSFASSFGKYEWEEDEIITKIVKSNLKKFKAISVREESGVAICKNIFDVNACLVLDPTLVYGNFDELVRDRMPCHEIFTFFLRPNKKTDEICDIISKETKLPLYTPNKLKKIFASGPISWLSKIKNSDFIITDSFHGLAFSLIFHKNFIVLCANEKKFARLHSLLKLVKLEERFFRSKDDLQNRLAVIHSDIDYKSVDKILAVERNKSLAFLKNNIS